LYGRASQASRLGYEQEGTAMSDHTVIHFYSTRGEHGCFSNRTGATAAAGTGWGRS
jgi:hypothetical protein